MLCRVKPTGLSSPPHCRISDDICVIYAALTTGRECYIVSNDHMSDNASMLGPEEAKLFSTWQAGRQITVQPTTVNLLVDKGFDLYLEVSLAHPLGSSFLEKGVVLGGVALPLSLSFTYTHLFL